MTTRDSSSRLTTPVARLAYQSAVVPVIAVIGCSIVDLLVRTSMAGLVQRFL